MVLIGLGAIYAAFGYNIGSLSHMGPGFFPASIGGLMVLMGILIAFSARTKAAETNEEIVEEIAGETEKPHSPHPSGLPDMRGTIAILIGIVAFIIIGQWGGLLPATFAIVFISALGDRTNTWKTAILLSLAMCVIAVVVFWWALQLQLPLFQWG
jgi:hypothetical protein